MAAKKATARTQSGAKGAPTNKAATKPARAPKAPRPGNLEAPAALEPQMPTTMLTAGAKAPAFTLHDQSGAVVRSTSLKGKAYVLYFYPKDNTSGCTREACDFRDQHADLKAAGVQVFGVSPDSAQSHEGFAAKFELPFRLLADPDKVLAQAYGAWGLKKNYGREYWGILRSTFLIGEDGKVQAVWKSVKVDGHVAKVLAKARGGAE